MSVKFQALASGSNGNASILQSPEGTLLIDAGISRRRILEGLRRLSIPLDSIRAILLTHSHGDHICGLPVLSNHLPDTPIIMTAGTKAGLIKLIQNEKRWKSIINNQIQLELGKELDLGPFQIESLPTKHDTKDSTGYCITYNNESVSILTDTGEITSQQIHALNRSKVALLEMNHDVMKLKNSARPFLLKQRISKVHLSNIRSLESLTQLNDDTNLQTIFIGHISGECNTHELISNEILEWSKTHKYQWQWHLAPRHQSSDLIEISKKNLSVKKTFAGQITPSNKNTLNLKSFL